MEIGSTTIQNKLPIGFVPNAFGKQIAIGNGIQVMTIDQTVTASAFNNGINSHYTFMGDGKAAADNVGIGTENPMEAKLIVNTATDINISAAFGTNGNVISIQKNSPTIAYNVYRDFNNANKYISNGYGFSTICDPTTGLFQFNKLGTGTAGSEIVLSDGFSVEPNNNFNAIIASCDTPPVPNAQIRILESKVPDFATLYLPSTQSTNHPFGTVRMNPIIKNGETNATIEVFEKGDFMLILSDLNGNEIKRVLPETFYEAGIYKVNFNLLNLTKQPYYLQLYCNNSLVHYQNIDL